MGVAGPCGCLGSISGIGRRGSYDALAPAGGGWGRVRLWFWLRRLFV